MGTLLSIDDSWSHWLVPFVTGGDVLVCVEPALELAVQGIDCEMVQAVA